MPLLGLSVLTDVRDRTALDLGASTGGFTKALLHAGAGYVYSVDVGFGQLLGSLRQDPRVANLERTNISDLSTQLVAHAIEIVTADLSYVALASALPQLVGRLQLAERADLIALRSSSRCSASTPGATNRLRPP